MEKFEFDCTYEGTHYHCLAICVKKGLDFCYAVELTRDGTSGTHRINVRASHDHCNNWLFTCGKGHNVLTRYPPALLEQVGEVIDKHNLRSII